jgi:uncharacterized protein (TIRG00374 family)
LVYNPAMPDPAPSAAPGSRRPAAGRGRLLRRVAYLVVTVVCLYLLAPALLDVIGSWPRLHQIDTAWIALMVALETASFACVWVLQRLALRTRTWRPVILSMVAGNAFGRVVPGGGAAAAAFQFGMLRDAGIAGPAAVTGLTAVNLLAFATLLALPVLALPALISGRPIAHDLAEATWIGFGALAVLFVVGAILLTTTAPLRWLGRAIQGLRNRVRRRSPPRHDLPDVLVSERDLILRALGRRWWQALLAAIGKWALDLGVLLVALHAVGASGAPSLVLLSYCAANVLGTIPATPGGLGFVEAGLTGTLTLAGVSPGDALVATLAYRLVTFWLPLPFGPVAVWLHRRARRPRTA